MLGAGGIVSLPDYGPCGKVIAYVRNNNDEFVNGYAIDIFARRNYLSMTPRDLFAVPARTALGQRLIGV